MNHQLRQIIALNNALALAHIPGTGLQVFLSAAMDKAGNDVPGTMLIPVCPVLSDESIYRIFLLAPTKRNNTYVRTLDTAMAILKSGTC